MNIEKLKKILPYMLGIGLAYAAYLYDQSCKEEHRILTIKNAPRQENLSERNY